MDDTAIFVYGRNLRVLRAKLQSDLNAISMWLDANKLKLNVMKTESLLFSKKLCNEKIRLFIDGQEIKQVKCFKFLGFYVDTTLSFEHHFHYLYKLLLNSLFIIR